MTLNQEVDLLIDWLRRVSQQWAQSGIQGSADTALDGITHLMRLQAENAKLKKHWFDDADPQETCFKDEFLEYRRTDFPKEPDNG